MSNLIGLYVSSVAIKYEFVEEMLSLVYKQDAVVLDIGSGRSVYKKSLKVGKYVGLDPYIHDDPSVIQASALNMPFEDSVFDLAFSVASLYLIGPDCMEEIVRVLKPGGKLLIFDYNKRVLKGLKAKTDVEHVTWSPHSLRKELNRAGLIRIQRLTHRPRIKSYYLQPISALKLKFRGSWVIFICEKPLS